MNCSSTHDTKRSEDIRARINVLTEMPKDYHAALFRWMAANEGKRTRLASGVAPTPSEEVLIYQSLLGAWPLDEGEVPEFRERFQGYVRKCAREAKENTSWLQPNAAHEAALEQFVDALFDPLKGQAFRQDFLELQRGVAFYGAFNALSQVLLKATAPGVPDFYQGTELWNFSLVDPDNRQAVDFRRRQELLENLKHEDAEDAARLAGTLSTAWRDGRIKLFTTFKTLEFRRAQAALFARGEYLPLVLEGPLASHALAFARRLDVHWCVVAIPLQLRSVLPMGESLTQPEIWKETTVKLPEGAPRAWRNVFTGEAMTAGSGKELRLPISALFGSFPVALLHADHDAP
jgi:(1->4)-alpha-D-glucan 1-alpha-D-glucosylmutase